MLKNSGLGKRILRRTNTFLLTAAVAAATLGGGAVAAPVATTSSVAAPVVAASSATQLTQAGVVGKMGAPGTGVIDSSNGWVDKTCTVKGGDWVYRGGDSWWYRNSDGSYPSKCVATIKGVKYLFDADGWAASGWGASKKTDKLGNKYWYHFTTNGLSKGWHIEGSARFYLDGGDGHMYVNWNTIGGKSYYFTPGGVMVTGWYKAYPGWYHFGDDGVLTTGWFKSGNAWYYLDPGKGSTNLSGAYKGLMLTGYQTIDGKRYYFDASGKWDPSK